MKKLRGNPGHRKLNDAEPTPAAGEPARPRGLTAAAIAEWKAIIPELARLGLLSRLDGKALAAYCMAFSRWMQAESEIARLGIVVEEPVLGEGEEEVVGYRYKRNPAVLIAQDSMKIMKSFLIEFGMTPASRSRLRIEKPKEEDPLEEFLSRGKKPNVHAPRVN